MKPNKVFSLLGLAMKAGKIQSGEFATEKAVKSGTGCLVVVATDASDNTKKMFTNMCTYYHVPLYFLGKKEELGAAIGKELRASLSVTDAGFAKALETQIKNSLENGGM